jgi:hypothetical protein
MLNEAEAAEKLVCPFCVLKALQLFPTAGNSQSAFGFECWKRIRTRRGNVGEVPQGRLVLGKKISRLVRLIHRLFDSIVEIFIKRIKRIISGRLTTLSRSASFAGLVAAGCHTRVIIANRQRSTLVTDYRATMRGE